MTTKQVIVNIVFDRWNALLKNCDTLLDSIPDEQLQKEIGRGKNRGIYVLGLLVAVHDDMITLLDFGEKQYAALFEIFVKSPDRSVKEIPTVQELRAIWKKQLAFITSKFESLSADEWFEKHNSVSAEDFIKEPHRNKLNIILTRTTHLAYHVGQLTLLK